MRARDIKPQFFLNDQLAECSFPARLAYPGLWMVADREGRLEYRPKRLKAEIFPYDDVDMVALLEELISNGLVVRYEVNNIEYLWIPTFLKHQKPHPNEKPSVIPPCPGNFIPEKQVSNTKVKTTFNQGDNNVTPRLKVGNTKEKLNPASSLTPSYIESSIKKESSLHSDSFSSEQSCDCSEVHEKSLPEILPLSPVVIRLPLNTGQPYPVTKSDCDHWQELFPAVDVMQELRGMLAWLEAVPKRRKTIRGIKRFITSWLSKSQDQCGYQRASPYGHNHPATPTEFQKNMQETRDMAAWLLAERHKEERQDDFIDATAVVIEKGAGATESALSDAAYARNPCASGRAV